MLFLGHVISAEGVKCDPKKVEAVRTWEAPRTARQVQQFLRTVNYYNRFIKNYSEIAKPLYAASNRKKKFEWTEECEQAFQTLRTALTTDPVMAYPNSTGLMILNESVAVGIQHAAIWRVRWPCHFSAGDRFVVTWARV